MGLLLFGLIIYNWIKCSLRCSGSCYWLIYINSILLNWHFSLLFMPFPSKFLNFIIFLLLLSPLLNLPGKNCTCTPKSILKTWFHVLFNLWLLYFYFWLRLFFLLLFLLFLLFLFFLPMIVSFLIAFSRVGKWCWCLWSDADHLIW